MPRFLRVLVCILPLAAWAEQAPAPPLEILEREALSAYPGVAQLRQKLAAASALENPAAALPDPMLELSLTDARFPRWTVGSEEMSMLGVSVQQGLLFPGKRQARKLAAEAETRVRAGELEALRAFLILQVRQTYARLYRLDAELAILAQAQELLAALSEAARTRYAAGLATQESVIKVLLQQARLSEQRADVEKERAETVARLNRLLNRPLGSPFGTVAALPPVPPPDPSWATEALERAPAVAIAFRELEAAKRDVAVAETELKPNLFASGGLGTRGRFGVVATFSLGVEWPLWKEQKQKPQLTAARAKLAAAEGQLLLVRAEVQEAVERVQAAWATAQEQLSRYRQELVPLSEAALAAARAAFTTGQNDFSTVIEDFNLWLEAQLGLSRRQADAFAAWAEVRYLLGDGGGEP